ncbi:SUF system NifU family Fe-S cluster assembly protein [Agromyces atrinae]|uniref:Nitrogen fixation NifU-like protein n=1 Tax=Agromyces atrinae TaxID=592376 RepID=A0A4Q2MAF5_9MICO|nr:SUF system NifU family Fe-S cluster assembly protein [Agromyces atrinae]MCI2959461.1 SUF system NifU family Fe-S cluster assembly protein [Agromyces atrinae]NYD68683.1 nitrogen fixation NifU-like protein [Agromyces atrinae]RXZ86050.1 SUF system NifU family Fe-S cluster assembly protein [Agromyces atrinae]
MSALDSLYQELILDHSKRRVGEGALDDAHAEHHEYNPTCGDEITVRIRVDGDRLTSIAWEGSGCSISMASASAMTELLTGSTLAEVDERIAAFREMLRSRGAVEPDEDVLGDASAFHGVSRYVMRVKCAMLAWVSLEADLAQVR